MTREPGRAPPRHAHGDLTSLAPHERLPEILVVPRDTESEIERKPEVPAFPGDEALFHCAKPSGVLRGPANSSASLICQKHTGKFPKVTGKLLLHKVHMKSQGIFLTQGSNPGLLHCR